MSLNPLGIVKPGSTIYLYFPTFDSNDPSASVTLTGLAVGDILCYKDGNMTQRASTSGFTLLDTDGIDLDGTTGIHGISIDLADNTTANFWEAGSHYVVVIASVTVDAATINFVLGDFIIGYEGAILNTTMATRASATSFTLEDGSTDDDAYNGCPILIHNLASAFDMVIGYVSDYTGATKTITLQADPGVITSAAGDHLSIFPPVNVTAWNNILLATTNPLPNAAPDSSGGLATEDASGHLAVDVREWLGNAVTASSGNPDVNVESIDDIDAPTTWKASINTEVDNALDTAVPASPTANSINERVKAMDELTESGGSGDLAAILTDTGTTLDGKLPSALSAAGNIKADVQEIDADADAAAQLRDNLDTTQRFVIDNTSFTATTTAAQVDAVFFGDTSGTLEATNDHYNGRIILFLTGALQGQATDITDYDGTNKRFTYTAVTEAPADNDQFVVI